MRPIFSHKTEQANNWSIEDLLYGQKENFLLQEQHKKSLRWLALLGSRLTECSIHFILPAQGFSHTVISALNHFRVMLVLLAFEAISQL